MNKHLSLVTLTLIMLIFLIPGPQARAISAQDEVDVGKVIEVIDGEILKVFFYRSNYELPVIKLVRMIGIDTQGSTEAFDYTASRVMGKTIFMTYDDTVVNDDFKTSYAHVYVDFDTTLAEELLEMGLAKMTDVAKESSLYEPFLSATLTAKINEVGLYATSKSETTDRININTADLLTLADQLDISQSLASDIISYRTYNPFNHTYELMAVNSSFNQEWYLEHAHLMHVMTNINQSSYLELMSLIPANVNKDLIISELLYYLRFNEVWNLDEILSEGEVGYYLLASRPYISTESVGIYEDEVKRVNINTVAQTTFVNITGLTTLEYGKLKTLREDHYISSIGELTKGSGILYSSNMSIYGDRLTAYTNYNTATYTELLSLLEATSMTLFERQNMAEAIIVARPYIKKTDVATILGASYYNQLDDFTYLYEEDMPERYNIMTAEEEDLSSLKIQYSGLYCHYTDVNLASRDMLMDLNADMSEDLVDAIIAYRSITPFYYYDDLKDLFIDYNKLALYNDIYHYLVFR